jgi:MSHA pilin protein MshD
MLSSPMLSSPMLIFFKSKSNLSRPHLHGKQAISGFSGFTLVELIITILLTSIAALMFANVYTTTQVQSATPAIQIKAAELGQSYLEEIGLKKFDENSPIGNALPCDFAGQLACTNTLGIDTAEVRETFDDIDDYHNLVDSPPQDATGSPRSGFSNFSVSISVSYAGTNHGFDNRMIKLIQVTVTTPQSTSFLFSSYKGNF